MTSIVAVCRIASGITKTKAAIVPSSSEKTSTRLSRQCCPCPPRHQYRTGKMLSHCSADNASPRHPSLTTFSLHTSFSLIYPTHPNAHSQYPTPWIPSPAALRPRPLLSSAKMANKSCANKTCGTTWATAGRGRNDGRSSRMPNLHLTSHHLADCVLVSSSPSRCQ